MLERPNRTVSKTVVVNSHRGFKSHLFRHYDPASAGSFLFYLLVKVRHALSGTRPSISGSPNFASATKMGLVSLPRGVSLYAMCPVSGFSHCSMRPLLVRSLILCERSVGETPVRLSRSSTYRHDEEMKRSRRMRSVQRSPMRSSDFAMGQFMS